VGGLYYVDWVIFGRRLVMPKAIKSSRRVVPGMVASWPRRRAALLLQVVRSRDAQVGLDSTDVQLRFRAAGGY
jgi:hypothetical protein